MQIESIRLRNFRNFEAIDIDCGPGFNLLLGGNARGKTSILEAVCILSTGESHKTATLKEVIRLGRKAATIKSSVYNGERNIIIELVISTGVNKALRVNGVAYNRKRKGTLIPTVVFSPDHLLLIKGPPDIRRSFIDRILVQTNPKYAYYRALYIKTMRERNAALQGMSLGNMDASLIDIYDEQLIAAGVELVKLRASAIQKISDIAKTAYEEITRGEMCARYVSQLHPHPAEEIVDVFKRKLREKRGAELARGITLVGPHRDDIYVTLDGRDARGYASQGEQRTACLALKFAEISALEESFHVKPILLLDDVMSELDESRRRALMQKALRSGQVFITSTNRDYFTAEELDSAKEIHLG